MPAHSPNIVSTPADLRIHRARLWGSLMQFARIGATDKGGVHRLALTELDREAHDQFIAWAKEIGCTVRVGIDPRRARFLLLKSRMSCRPVFVPIAAALVECDSRGVTSSDYRLFRLTHVKRPIYPLDPHTDCGHDELIKMHASR